MGRFAKKTSALTAKTVALMPQTELTYGGGVGAVGGYLQFGMKHYQSGTITATTTLVSVNGPGVLKYFDITPTVLLTGSCSANISVYLDNNLVGQYGLNMTNETHPLFCCIGANIGNGDLGYRNQFTDEIPFSQSLVITVWSAPAQNSMYYYSYSYRLTN